MVTLTHVHMGWKSVALDLSLLPNYAAMNSYACWHSLTLIGAVSSTSCAASDYHPVG
jgi:hypothetical protein